MKEVKLESYKIVINIGASRIKQISWFVSSIIFFQNPLPIPSFIKSNLLRVFGANIGKNVRFKPSILIKYPWKLSIGDYSWIGESVWIDNLENVSIGKNCCLSQGALLLTGSHNAMKSTFDYSALPISIQDGVWIGAKAIIAPGVICGSHSILSVGSVAEKNLEPYIIYKGNPAIPVINRIIN